MARSRTLGEARWSPGGARLAWLEAFGGRVDLVVAAADGSAPRGHRHRRGPGDPARGVRRRRVLLGGRRHAGVRGRRRPPRRHRRRRRRAARALARRPRRRADRRPRWGPRRVRARARRRLRRAPWSASTAPTGRDVSRTPTTRGIPRGRPTAAGSPGTSGTSRTCRGTGRASCCVAPDCAQARRGVVAGGDDVAVGQPRFSPDRRHAGVRVGSRRVDERVARRPVTARAPVPLLDEPHEHADPSWGPGQRSFAWSPDGAAIVLNRNEDGFGRLVRRRPRRRGARSSVSRGWHPGLDWGPAGVACIRSGGRTAPAAHRRSTRAPAPAPPGPAARPPSSTPSTCPSPRRSRGRAATASRCTGSCGVRPTPTPTRPGDGTPLPPLLVDVHGGPTDQSTVDWKPRVRYFVSRGWAVLHPNYRGSTGYGAGYRHALDHEWGVLDVADTVAGIRAAGAEGWGDPARVAVMGGSAGGFTALLVAAQHAAGRARGGEPLRRDRPLRPRGHDAPLRVALPRPARRSAARRRRAVPRRGRPSRTRTRSPCRARAPGRRRQGGAARAGAAARRRHAGGRRARSSTTCTRARGTASRRPTPSSTRSTASTGSSRSGWCNDDRARHRVRLAGPEARRRPRRAARARRRLRPRRRGVARRSPTRWRRRRCRRCASTTRTAPPAAGARPARRCSTPRRARRRPSWPTRAKLPPERLVLGGRSMGGRYCSMVVGADDDPVPALGLLMLSYPLHAAGKPEKPRTEHFPALRMPVLFVSGTRDSLAGQAALTTARQGHPRPGHLPLDRDRRPRLPAAEGEWPHHRRRAVRSGRNVRQVGARRRELIAH